MIAQNLRLEEMSQVKSSKFDQKDDFLLEIRGSGILPTKCLKHLDK